MNPEAVAATHCLQRLFVVESLGIKWCSFFLLMFSSAAPTKILSPGPRSCSSMSSPSTSMECGEDRQLLAEATAALLEHLDFEEKHVQQKHQQLEQELDQKIPAKFAKGEKEKDCKNPSPSDTIRLNVGGDTSFTTRRDTLTAISGSRLALLFSGRWDRSLRRDEKGRVFLDVDPVQFRALLVWFGGPEAH